MADTPAGERTEQATPQRLQKAREEGRIPQSNELPAALAVGALLLVLATAGPTTFRWFQDITERGLTWRGDDRADGVDFQRRLSSQAAATLTHLAPYLVVLCVASVLGCLLVSGWAYSPKQMEFDISRLSLARGIGSVFSMKSVVSLVISLGKLVFIGVIVYLYLRENIGTMLKLRWATPAATVGGIAQLIFGVMFRLSVGLLVFGLLDMAYQKWSYKRQMRMTRQEVKEEMRQHELAPELRGRIRAIQFAMARKRMMRAVPTADVVVTNPTHFAVALKYDPKTMDAPMVVAKGPDLLAKQIKDIAREHNVPIIEKPELARTLYHTVEIGQSVPETLFVAVAEVLAMIYRLKRRRN